MRVINYSKNLTFDCCEFPEDCPKDNELFILCRTHEVSILREVFDFDESTVLNCQDLDESVRYTSFPGYDFVSMVHIEMSEKDFTLREINLYVSKKYLVLVMPEHESLGLINAERKLLDAARPTDVRPERLNRLYFLIFHYLLADFSDTLEKLEDWMQELSDEIVAKVEKNQFSDINDMRSMAYTAKKQIRALSYLGEQILVDENSLILKNQMRYFRSVDTRLKKLYDFAESLYNLSGEMLYTYDSRLTMKTNDTVNKLTAMTLFFGPLTVITGIYGMNFDIMPELHWSLGYPMAISAMIIVSLIVYIILKKKKWL